MAGIDVKVFDLAHTFESAQPLTFYADYDHINKRLVFPYKGKMAQIHSDGNSKNATLHYQNISKADVVKIFRLHDDMDMIYSKIATDRFVSGAIDRYYGMRLTLNDPWQTTVCFILSQVNNVKRIRSITKCIMKEFGDRIDDSNSHSFPAPDRLVGSTKRSLMRCGTGFRWKYLLSAAEYCSNNMDLNKLKDKDYQTIVTSLMEIDGIGEKVADCIALFGFGKLEAFPTDVWVKRTMEQVYFKGRAKTVDTIREFAQNRFNPYEGYAQQYIFWHGRQVGV